MYNDARRAVRALLSEAAFVALWQQGQVLPIDEAVLIALAVGQLAIGA